MTKTLILSAALAMFLPGQMRAQPRYDGPPPRGGPRQDISRLIADCDRRTDEFRRSFRYASERGFRDVRIG